MRVHRRAWWLLAAAVAGACLVAAYLAVTGWSPQTGWPAAGLVALLVATAAYNAHAALFARRMRPSDDEGPVLK